MVESFLIGRFMTFTFVLARVGAVVATAPVFALPAIPMRIRSLLAVALALLVTPIFGGSAALPAVDLADYGWRMANEVLVGLLLGLGIAVLFAGVQIAGQIVSQMSGMSLADVFHPGGQGNVSVFSQLFFMVALAVFVAVGGHRQVMAATLDTFVWAPPGQAALGHGFLEVLTNIVTQSFVLGIRAGAPVMIALLLASVVLGLISRTLPQINAMTIGFGINSLVALGALFVSLGVIAWTLQDQTEEVLRQLQLAVRSLVVR